MAQDLFFPTPFVFWDPAPAPVTAEYDELRGKGAIPHRSTRIAADATDEDQVRGRFETRDEAAHAAPMPIASLMELGADGFATVMEPPDRQGHGATCRVG
jgi:hypothetical protein